MPSKHSVFEEVLDMRSKIAERKAYRAFTLIELMIVIAIIGVLTGIGISQYASSSHDAKRKRALMDIKQVCDSIRTFNRMEKKKFHKVQDLSQLLGKYIQNIPKDPWGRSYKVDGTYVYSLGEDGVKSADDIRQKYERDSIVENPKFVPSQDASGVERPGGWKMNPDFDPANKEANKNVVSIDNRNTTTVGSGTSVVIK